MELTRERITKYSNATIGVYSYSVVKNLAIALLAEIDKPKVWDGAPEWANEACINWYGKNGQYDESGIYTREPPKSRIDEIAEEAASKWAGGKKALEDAIKSAILRALEEKESVR